MTTAELRAIVPRVIAKLEDDDYIEALKIAENNTKVSNKIGPLRCYIYYKQSQYQRVLDIYKTLHGNVQKEYGTMHLLAQTHYKIALRSGDYAHAISTYHSIGELHPHEALKSAEYVSNALAAYVNGGDIKKAKTLLEKINFDALSTSSNNTTQSDLVTYETLFNASFVHMQDDNVDKALDNVEKAYSKFQIECGDDVDASEDALIQYHIAYLQRLQGKYKSFNDVFGQLYNDIDSFSPAVQSILKSNAIINKLQSVTSTTITIENNEKVFDLIKDIEQLKEENADKLAKVQLNLLNFNLSLLYTLNRSYDHVPKLVSHITQDRVSAQNGSKNVSVINIVNPTTGQRYHKDWLLTSLQCYVLIKDKEYVKCDALLDKFNSSISSVLNQTDKDTATYNTVVPYYMNLQLTRMYLALYRNQTNTAITILDTFVNDPIITTYLQQQDTNSMINGVELKQQPAILALYITLYENIANYAKCAEYVDETISLYQKNTAFKNDNNAQRIITQLRVKNATIKAAGGDYKGAINTLESLANQCDKKNSTQLQDYYHYLAQIVTLAQKNEPELVSKYAVLIPDPEIDDVDINVDDFALQVQTNEPTKQRVSKFDAINQQQQFLPNGKHRFTVEKLAAVRLKKKQKRQKNPRLPKNITFDQYLIAKNEGFIKVDQYRWRPKWERPQVATKGKKGQQLKALGKGPQGSGISENKVETNATNAGAGAATTADDKKQQIKAHLKNQKGKKGRK